MNLQSLYDLKDRLEYAAIAGTGLLHEDFRLRRAVEALAPLAKANPVFGKISAGATTLLNAPENARSTKLLDVLSLVDAVVYTQGASGISGTLTDLEPGFGSYVQVSYGELQPLLTALSGTGSGRTSLIREYWERHPEYFSDFRVLPHVVGALGDNYGELADMIGEILLKQGLGIIPMLKDNFDPAGKAEMARRVRLIAKLAGEQENNWFVSILPESKKDIREAIIQTLSLSKENNQLLLDLCQTEKGKLKEAAMRSLAVMDTEEAREFWKKEIRKKPNAVSCLRGVGSVLAADLVAESLRVFLEELHGITRYTSNQLDTLVMLTDAICGKYSEQVSAIWQQISGNMNELARITPDETVRSGDLSVAEHLQRCMMLSVLCNPCQEMISLVRDLAAKNRPWFLCCVFLADLMVQTPEFVYSQYSPFLISDDKPLSIFDRNVNTQLQMLKTLACCSFEKQGFCLEYRDYDVLSGSALKIRRAIPGLDASWAMYLANAQNRRKVEVYDLAGMYYPGKREISTDDILMKIVDVQNQRLCDVCGRYFSKRVQHSGKLTEYMDALLRCGWKDWQGMIVHSVRKENQIRYYWLMETLEKLPMTNAQKAAELRELTQLVESGSVSVWAKIWPAENIQMLIAQLDANASVTNEG